MRYASVFNRFATGPPRAAKTESPKTSAPTAKPMSSESTIAERTRWPYSAYPSGSTTSAVAAVMRA
jgi:hypothetical protein